MGWKHKAGRGRFLLGALSQLVMVLRCRALSAPWGGVLLGGPGPSLFCPGETGVGLPLSLGLHGAGWG